jgi:phosphoribosylformylglycinamidine (FGAM) synthase-like enzyme
MAARGGVGFEIHLDRVPLRDSSMVPEEILLSESQERMLMIVRPENLARLKAVFAKWDLDAEAIGEVTKGPEVQLHWRGESICKMDPRFLVDEAPRYNRPFQKWVAKHPPKGDFIPIEAGLKSATETLLGLLRRPEATGRSWIYNQYDQRVGAKTAADCSESVGVLRLPATQRALGLVLGCRPYVMRTDAALGATDSIAYPALELAAKGFQPLAATDCLNFGNPENSVIMSEFVATIESMSAQCEAMQIPVISGNVSFYNETLGENITSTPATGLVGLRDSVENLPKSKFVNKNDEIYLLRCPMFQMQGLLAEIEGSPNVGVGALDPQKVAKFVDLTRHLALMRGVRATRVVGKLGLAYALARMCGPDLGASVQLDSKASHVFAETLYEVIFAVDPDSSFAFREMFAKIGESSSQSLVNLGAVREGPLQISSESGLKIDLALSEIQKNYNTSWEVLFAGLS